MKTRQIVCEYQPYIFGLPTAPERLYQSATSNDEVTINVWADKWIANIKANHKHFGGFSQKGIGNLFGIYRHRPVIVAGSGPSLKYNVDKLKEHGDIPLVSCLHNFQYFMDNDVKVDYWVSLDAGEVTIEEVSEGGTQSEEHYWAKTKDQKLIAFIGSHPDLLKKWQGDIYFYNAPVPDEGYRKRAEEIETFNQWVSNGGNVLGASMYISKGYFGAGTIIFVGADFSFGYDRKFHSWDSKYDKKMGRCVPDVDIFGNKVPTWQSYKNFKNWFCWVASAVPGIWINASEGGCLGSFPEGNTHHILQMDLAKVLEMYNMSKALQPVCENPQVEGDDGRRILF